MMGIFGDYSQSMGKSVIILSLDPKKSTTVSGGCFNMNGWDKVVYRCI